MPNSYSHGKEEIIEYIKKNIEEKNKILDVGPGSGIYGKMLKNFFNIDCIEIFPKYIKDYDLDKIYNEIFIGDICEFNFENYDLIIMGDVLEHIRTEDAKKLIFKITHNSKKTMVAVPYNYKQGEWGGNIYETHHQDDLTPQIMSERYPELNLIVGYPNYGYYANF